MPKLLIATNNPGKAAEFQTLLDRCGWELVTPADVGVELGDDEPHDSYAENAELKARRGAEASGLVTLADDSGIEIEAMNGEPGVHSARFLGDDATYQQRFAEIERRLEGIPPANRGARFICVIAVADPKSGNVRFAEGEVRGLIAQQPRGDRGFGYDPIFWIPQRSATMAEVPQHEKDIISHRARAAAPAREILKELLYEHSEADPGYAREPS
ncbi:MAG: RdgB/HAM1 family non-canonical purine NTP pyrophosphatase [Chloroflexi bacterium]|nr:RdgB/HAM1 family non-canonical purine NTP pyrophosphatase [Chloroflexota bacterium]